MPKAVDIITPFHNLPTGDLVDQLGGLKSAIADLEKRQRALWDELLFGAVEQVDGAQFGATIAHSVRWTLDTQIGSRPKWRGVV